ncbi:hypothetical protein MFRU_004g02290 [Monilinia fructicola]|nr:hypothetical protein MFRU_004g02290 [Monilinia fructicola]
MPEREVETTLPELPNTTVDPSISTSGYVSSNTWSLSSSTSLNIVLQSSTLKGFPTPPGIAEADSISIKELSVSDFEQIPSGITCNHPMRDPLSTIGDRSSHGSDFDSSRKLNIVDAVVDKQNPVETVPSIQSPKLPGGIIIPTDMHQFRDRYNSLQHQGDSFKTPRYLSSPDTPTTTDSGYALSTNSGYGSVPTDSYHSSICSPGSSNPGNDKSGRDTLFYCQVSQSMSQSDFSLGNYPSQNIHSHSHSQSIDVNGFVHEEPLDLAADTYEINNQSQVEEWLASYCLEVQKNQFESDSTGTGHFSSDGRMVQVTAEMNDSSLNDNWYTGEEPQSLQSPFPMQTSDDSWNNGAHVFTQARSAPDQYNSDLQFRRKGTAHTPPWSAESIGRHDCNANITTFPDTQFPIEGLATTPNHDDSFPKTGRKIELLHCPYCSHEPRGQKTWKQGNLNRHIKEIHESYGKVGPACYIPDCRKIFSRTGNLNTHLVQIHGIYIPRKKRTKRTVGIKPIKRSRASERAMNTAKRGLKNSQSQPASNTLEGDKI